jgi:hypothetical protein
VKRLALIAWAYLPMAVRMRILLYACGIVASLVVGFIGWLGVAVAGICDTSCPSDRALAIYHVLFYGGGAGFLVLVGWLIMRRFFRD